MNPIDKYTPMAPYLFRAYYDWMTDNELTPFIYVDTNVEGVSVPSGSIDEKGGIVLNIGVNATGDFFMDETEITFKSRFQGKIHEITVPYSAVLGMWERNGEVQFMMPETPEATEAHEDNSELMLEAEQEAPQAAAEPKVKVVAKVTPAAEAVDAVNPVEQPRRPTIKIVN